MATARGTWKAFERQIATDWTKVIGLLCKRNPMSGASNCTDKGQPRPGDVIIHSDFNPNVLLEAKYRASFIHHSLFRNAELDAKKHKISEVLLLTKKKHEDEYLVTMTRDLFYRLLAIKEVQQIFKRQKV